MTSLTRWNPLHEMETFARRFSDLFGRTAFEGVAFDWKPSVDIHETPEHFELRAELPGVKKEDVKLTLENGLLTLTGERKSEQETKETKAHRIERTFGRFERSFALPDTVDPEKILAEYKDGILLVKLAKRPAPPEKQPKSIAINAT
ncbi:MAG: Hsp20/alpha crystallin family protein [Myxococcota bacterium]